jgi:hypothetical protein
MPMMTRRPMRNTNPIVPPMNLSMSLPAACCCRCRTRGRQDGFARRCSVGLRTDHRQPQRPSSNPTKWGEVPSEARRRGGVRFPEPHPSQACLAPPRSPPSSSRNDVRAQRRTPYPGSMPRRLSPRSGAERGACRRRPCRIPRRRPPPPSSLRDATSAPTAWGGGQVASCAPVHPPTPRSGGDSPPFSKRFSGSPGTGRRWFRLSAWHRRR